MKLLKEWFFPDVDSKLEMLDRQWGAAGQLDSPQHKLRREQYKKELKRQSISKLFNFIKFFKK